ncbi:MAG: sporulation protein YunB [Clostridiales bacterium]|nr:MAG: sporulation protein YunB [Clostridiales bacterium]
MIMRKRRLSLKGKLLLTTVSLFFMLIFIMCYYNIKMRPIIKIMASSRVEDFATDIINKTVLTELEKENITYDDIITLEKTSEGFVSAVKTNSILINRLKANIAVELLQDSNLMENENVYIPIGSLMDTEIFSGKGPKIPIKIVPVGNVFVTVRQEFIPAGINQTLHRIMLKAIVEADLVLPTEMARASYESEFIIAETVIVGDIPSVYANLGVFSSSTNQEK